MPGALLVIDQKREVICGREARKMGIPVVCMLDTDCDPDLVDIPIPGNDDAMRAIELVVKELADTIAEAIAGRKDAAQERAETDEERRRGRRPAGARADEAGADEKPQPAAEAAPSAPPAGPTA
jgi:small subunit ribosomal protein S2